MFYITRQEIREGEREREREREREEEEEEGEGGGLHQSSQMRLIRRKERDREREREREGGNSQQSSFGVRVLDLVGDPMWLSGWSGVRIGWGTTPGTATTCNLATEMMLHRQDRAFTGSNDVQSSYRDDAP